MTKTKKGNIVIKKNRCNACGCYTGPDFSYGSLEDFREHKICPACVSRWQYLEELNKTEVSWVEMMTGRIIPECKICHHKHKNWQRDNFGVVVCDFCRTGKPCEPDKYINGFEDINE